MQTVLIEMMCLPPIPVIRTIVRHSNLLIESKENYQKRSFRNRIYLNSPQGRTLFSIPLEKGKNQKMPIREAKIASGDPWATVLMKQIQSCYGSAPYFDFIIDDLRQIINKEWVYLFDLNMELWNWVQKQLGTSIVTNLTSDYQKEVNTDINDLRNSFKPNEAFFDSTDVLPYQQVFTEKHGFVPHLSIIDMLMCLGPESLLKLRST